MSRKQKDSRKSCRRQHLRVEALERRELMAADLMGVVRGADLWMLDTNSDPLAEVDRNYGLPGDIYVAGKWNGGNDMMGVVRPGGDGLLHWLLDTNGDRNHDIEIPFGLPGDTPVVGDWDRDGRDNIGVVRNGNDGLLHWYYDLNRDPNAELEIRFGLIGDVPVAGDWDGDGRDNPAVVRPGIDGLLHWYFDQNGDPWAESESRYGLPGDKVISGDWDGNGRDNMGVLRPGADGLMHWLLDTNGDPAAEQDRAFGYPSDRFVAGEWQFSEIEVVGASDNTNNQWPSIPIGSVAHNGTTLPEYTFRVRNLGNASLALSGASISNGFTIVKGLAASLAPGGVDTITVRLNDSTVVGTRNGVLTINNDDGNETPYTVRFHAVVTAPEIAIDGINDGQATPISFGVVNVGVDATRGFTVRNMGTSPLSLGAVQVTGSFSLVQGLPAVLNPGETAVFRVKMDSVTEGPKSGSITLTNNDADENPFNFAVAGTVQIPAPPVPVPEIDIVGVTDGQVAAIDFGTVAFGATSIRDFTMRNLGTAPLTIGTIQVETGFTIVNALPTSIAPGGSAILRLRMDTSTSGTRSANVVVPNNDSNESPYNFRVTGQVRAPIASTPEIDVVGIADGQATATSFGTAVVGSVRTHDFTVRNIGTAPLSISNVTVTGGFTIVLGLPTSIAPNSSAVLRIGMVTTTAGSRSGAVSIFNNDSDENPYNFPIVGTVVAATPEVDVVGIVDGQSAAIDFGTAYVGTTSTRSFTVRNLGTGTLTLGQVQVTSGFSVTQQLPASLAAGVSATFTIAMNTASSGSKRATVSFTNNDSNESPYNFTVSGNVTAVTSNFGTVVSWQKVSSSAGTIIVKEVRINDSEVNSHRIYADFLSLSGTSIRTDVRVSDFSLYGNHVSPRVTALPGGNFAIAWVNNNGTASGGVRYSILGATGTYVGTIDRRANIVFSSNVSLSSIRPVTSTGGFIITWRDLMAGQTKQREFTRNGVGVTGEVIVS